VTADLVDLEDVALFRDVTPPEVVIEVPRPGSHPALAARVTDRGAGVTWRTLSMRLDGEPLLVEWDPDARRLRAHLRRDLPPGDHELEVTARDRVGNATTVRRGISVP